MSLTLPAILGNTPHHPAGVHDRGGRLRAELEFRTAVARGARGYGFAETVYKLCVLLEQIASLCTTGLRVGMSGTGRPGRQHGAARLGGCLVACVRCEALRLLPSNWDALRLDCWQQKGETIHRMPQLDPGLFWTAPPTSERKEVDADACIRRV